MHMTRFLLLLFPILVLGSCTKDTCTETNTYTVYSPLYQPVEEVRSGVAVEGPRELTATGKIYVYGSLLLINEPKVGIHLINNSDPSNPSPIAFLAIPGNVDMAMYDGRLYADSYMDLLTFDLRDIAEPVLVDRDENVFPHLLAGDNGVLVGYAETEQTLEYPCHNGAWIWLAGGDIAVNETAADPGGGQSIGIGGSTARFTIANGHLYTVDEWNLQVFALNSPGNPTAAGTQSVGWGIETIYPFADKLFLGSQNGMFIYDISEPLSPVQLSAFAHARACDPVVSDGTYAYVTLRDGTICEGFINQLDVIDIRNLTNPKLVKTYPMTHPIGLAVRDDLLMICDDHAGLKIYDKQDVNAIDAHQLATISRSVTDVIALPYNDLILVIGPDGFYQYDLDRSDSAQFGE